MTDISLYIHIPFCAIRCGYCDFCSSTDKGLIKPYLDALGAQMKLWSGKLSGVSVASVYFGGGTPTVIGADSLISLLNGIKNGFNLTDVCEITLEANPGTVNAGDLKLLRNAGFNRISAGMQSGLDTELKALMRLSHTSAMSAEFVKAARDAGFDNISLDLMYGIPQQTLRSLSESLDFVISLAPEHISTYALKLEEGTPLYKANPTLPDDDTVADMYELICDTLSKHGYNRYEISNFSKPNYESRHNSRYWTGENYIGLGASASSLYKGRRFTQCRDVAGFIRGDACCEDIILTPYDVEFEYIMLRLRLSQGIDIADYNRRFNSDFDKKYRSKYEKYLKGGFAVRENGRFFLTGRGMFVSNAIISDILY